MLSTDMMGTSMPAEFARLAGYPSPLAVTAAGSSATDATSLNKDSRVVLLTATGADGVKLASDAPLMCPYIFLNVSGSTGIIYPPTSGTLNEGTATTGGLSLATHKVAILWRLSTNRWAYILTA